MSTTNHRSSSSNPTRVKTKKSHKKKNKTKKIVKNDVPKIKIAALQEYEDISPASDEASEPGSVPVLVPLQRSPSPIPVPPIQSKPRPEKKKKNKKNKGSPKSNKQKRKRSLSPKRLVSVNKVIHSPISPPDYIKRYKEISPVSSPPLHTRVSHAVYHDSEYASPPAKKKSKKQKLKKAQSPVLPRAYQPKQSSSPSPYRSPERFPSLSPPRRSSIRKSRSPYRRKSPSPRKSTKRRYRSPSRSPYWTPNKSYSPYGSPCRSPYRSPRRSPTRSPYHTFHRRSPVYKSRSGHSYSPRRSPTPHRSVKSVVSSKNSASKSRVESTGRSQSKASKHSGTELDGKPGSSRNSVLTKRHQIKSNESSLRKSPTKKLTEDRATTKPDPKVPPDTSVQANQKNNLSTVGVKAIPETLSPITPPCPEIIPPVPLPQEDQKSQDAPPLPSDEPPPLPPEEEKPPPPALPPLPLPPVLPGLPDESPISESSEVSELPKEEGEKDAQTLTDSKPTTPVVLSTSEKSEDESDEEGEWGERCVDMFDIIAIVGEGTFGQVYKAKEKLTGMYC